MKIGTLWARSYGPVITLLSIIATVLFVAVLFHYRIISKTILVQNKNFIELLSTIITTSIVLLGALFSYFRFFRGRTLAPRLKLSAHIDVIKATDTEYLHVLNFEVTNIGSVAIWNLRPDVEIQYHGTEQKTKENITAWQTPMEEDNNKISMLDTEESSQYIVRRLVPIEIWAVTYYTKATLESGHSWRHAVTVSNTI
jgi:hypothetical protein